ncbi:hypothetical protein D3C87_1409620 [compost metagenome]
MLLMPLKQRTVRLRSQFKVLAAVRLAVEALEAAVVPFASLIQQHLLELLSCSSAEQVPQVVAAATAVVAVAVTRLPKVLAAVVHRPSALQRLLQQTLFSRSRAVVVAQRQ